MTGSSAVMDSNGNVLSVDFTHRLRAYQQRYVMKTEIYETIEAKSLRPASQTTDAIISVIPHRPTDALPVCLANRPKTNKQTIIILISFFI